MGRLRTNPDAINLIKEYKYYLSDNKKKYFNNTQPLYLEIGMGKGNFILTSAINNPNINYIGVEKYPTVILKAFKKFDNTQTQLNNLKVISDDANNLKTWFKKEQIDKIYLNFSDPWPKKRHANKRLTSNGFMMIYKYLLKPHGTIEFKTDNAGLYEYTLDEWKCSKSFKIINYTNDLYSNNELLKNNVPTEYETKFHSIGTPIKKIIIVKK